MLMLMSKMFIYLLLKDAYGMATSVSKFPKKPITALIMHQVPKMAPMPFSMMDSGKQCSEPLRPFCQIRKQ